MWYKLKNSLKKLENKSALTSLWSILGFTPKIFTSKTTVWFHGWQFGVKVIGNVRHLISATACPPLNLSKLAARPSYCAAASTGSRSRSAKMGLILPTLDTQVILGWLVCAKSFIGYQDVGKGGLLKNKKRNWSRNIFWRCIWNFVRIHFGK